jgi:apolipoprotein N-acyltransferase
VGFAPLGFWPVTLVALAGLMASVAHATSLKAALARGYWFGIGYFCLGLNWIAGAFQYQDAMPHWLGWIAVVALSLYIAVYPAMAAGLAWRWGRKAPHSFVFVFAGAWVVTEYLRATMFTGFAWNPLGVAMIEGAGLAPVVGTYGLSALMILAAGGLWLASKRRWLTSVAFLAMPFYSLLLVFVQIPGPNDARPGPLLRIVQPNIAQQDKHDASFDAVNFGKLEQLTGKPGATPRLILWPEAAIPDFIEEEEWARERVASLLGPADMLLTGGDALIYNSEGRLTGARNSVFVVTPGNQIIGRYDKAHLVPYGEYLALRWLLEPLGATRLVPGDLDFIPGPGPQSFAVPGFGKVGVQICYEIIFSGQVVDRANRPDFLYNPSNDAWFGSWGPPQHLAQARLRSIEEGLPIVRSTPTGISAIIDADGTVLKSLPYKKAGFIEAHLPMAHAPTLFARFGNLISLAFAFFLCAMGIALRPKQR